MRRSDRETKERSAIKEILDQCKVCRIGMQDDEGLYVVPLNFGYAFEEDDLALYFHSAPEGRKVDALRANNRVCIEMDCDHRLVTGETACAYGYAFKSIIGNGKASLIEDQEDMKIALSVLMKHQTGQEFSFADSMLKDIAVFRILVDTYTAKIHL